MEDPDAPRIANLLQSFFPLAERLVWYGVIKPHPIEVRTGGLGAIVVGIEDLRNGDVEGRKLVYQIA